ncbi:MAG: tetratricopeptide repeat protein [Candidatus Eisenbacteria bacterium]|nr:tetratricopeptide repeat protein [Candidatus Eisenbacteria bacterium]
MWPLVWLTAAIARIVEGFRRGVSAKEYWTPAGLANALDQAEVLMLEGAAPRAREWLVQTEPHILKMQGPDGVRLRARYRAVLADLAGWTGQRDRAIEQLNLASTECDRITDAAYADELRTRIEAARGLMTTPGDAEGPLVASGRRALEREPETRRPEVLMRLAWLAHRLGQIAHARGRWEEARHLLDRAVAIGMRLDSPGTAAPDTAWNGHARALFCANARKAASEAARELGLVHASLGDRDRAIERLDQAIAVVEGVDHPIARLRLAQALLDRANQERTDPLAGAGRREALIARAAEVALESGTPEGRAVAGMAEVALAHTYASLGMTAQQLEHLRRALEYTKDSPEPAAGHNQTYLLMAIGHALDESGDRDGASDALRQAVARGRAHPDPDTRKFAVSAAYRLHQMAWEDDHADEARAHVEVIESLVPTLAADVRGVFAGIAAHSRGLQYVLEGRDTEGTEWLARAERMGRDGGPAAGALARSAAADLGRAALRARSPGAAEAHLRRALDTPAHHMSAADDRSQRAEITLLLADALRLLDRFDEGRRECARAFDLGRDAGNAKGREAAAIAAMWLGESADDDPAERRRFYEAASRLGRLCGRTRGREVADTVDRRLREVTG